jgi:transcriptional regulator with XRE-family HTH domain
MQAFGEFLATLRNNAGLSLQELAIRVGTSKSRLSRLENSNIPKPYKGPVRKLIIDLAAALSTSKKDTERYLALAGIDRSLLTQNEEIMLGLAPPMAINPSSKLQRDDILLLNFAHPLTEQQRKQIELLTGTSIKDIITIPALINEAEPLGPQIAQLTDAAGLTVDEWNQRNILINLPGYAPAASLLLAEIHGRTGHFPTILRLRPKHRSVTNYEIAEIINLQTFRDKARMTGNTPTLPTHTVKT